MSSKDYWKKREEEHLRQNKLDEAEYDKQIRKIYGNMLQDVQQQINAFYGRFAAREGITLAEAKKRISKADMAALERKAKRYVEDKEFSQEANERMRLYNATMRINRLEMLKAELGMALIDGHQELDEYMEKLLQGRTEDELKRMAGILGTTIRNNSQTAQNIVNASFHNATFSNRIWMHQDLLKADVDKLLQQGMIQGKNPRVLAKELEKRFAVTSTNAERLMRTELARVQTDAQVQSFIKNGFDEYTFNALGSACDECKPLDGKHFKIADMLIGENAPPIHPNCRCAISAYMDDDAYEAWLDHMANGGEEVDWQTFRKDAAAKKTVQFTPAKTIAEAEEYAKRFAETVSYKGITDIDAANEINKTLTELYDRFDLAKLKKIYTNSRLKSSGARADWEVLELNPASINAAKTYKPYDWLARVEKNKKKIAETLHFTDASRYPADTVKSYKKYIKALEKENLYTRYDVTTGNFVRDLMQHEFGHVIADQYFGQIAGSWANPNYESIGGNALLEQKKYVKSAYNNAKKTGDLSAISYYGATDEYEFFAEAFVMYMTDMEMPEAVKKMVEKVLTNGKL